MSMILNCTYTSKQYYNPKCDLHSHKGYSSEREAKKKPFQLTKSLSFSYLSTSLQKRFLEEYFNLIMPSNIRGWMIGAMN